MGVIKHTLQKFHMPHSPEKRQVPSVDTLGTEIATLGRTALRDQKVVEDARQEQITILIEQEIPQRLKDCYMRHVLGAETSHLPS